MEIVYLIVTIIGFIILGWYQRYYIQALKRQIEAQRDILDSQAKTMENIKMYVDIFQPEKIREFVMMRESTFEDIKNNEIDNIKVKLEGKFKNHAKSFKLLMEEYVSAIRIIMNLFYYVQNDLRHAALEMVPDSVTKTNILDNIDKFPNCQNEYLNFFAKAISLKGLISLHNK